MLNDAWKRGMDISQITSQPGMKLPTVEVSSNDSVTNLVDMILRNNTSSVLITENGCSLGVISDREVLKEIVEKRKDPSVMKVNDLQYTPIIVLDKTDPVTKALKIMQQKKAARIAIVKDGQLVGMLTEKSVTNKRDLAVNVQVSRKKQLA
jgi:predicted transcriptional regulator